MEKKLILLVCSGNMFRSPVAAFCLNRVFTQTELGKLVEASSRGIQGLGGTVPPKYSSLRDYSAEWKNSNIIFAEYKINIDNHRSAVVTPDVLEKSLIVLAMDYSILYTRPNSLVKLFPHYAGKMKLYSELIGKSEDIEDVFGIDDLSIYKTTVQKIDNIAKQSTEYINKLLKINNVT